MVLIIKKKLGTLNFTLKSNRVTSQPRKEVYNERTLE